MRTLLFGVIAVVAAALTGCYSTKVNTRDYQYEAYCDSIYETNPCYYLDVLVETDKYIDYIEKHGEWWN